jgi:putative oxidoreductase
MCLAAIFIWAAAGKIMFYDINSQYMASKGLTMIPVFLFGAALVELLGGLSLILGYKTRLGAAILLLFLIPTTFIFHDFWNAEGAARLPEQVNFMKNVAIFGGLLYVLVHGAGGCALDKTGGDEGK